MGKEPESNWEGHLPSGQEGVKGKYKLQSVWGTERSHVA